MEKRRFDPARIARLLHYEKIPKYIMTDEQKKYLEDWRREALNRPTFADDKAREAVVVKVNTKPKKKTSKKKSAPASEPVSEPVSEPAPEKSDLVTDLVEEDNKGELVEE